MTAPVIQTELGAIRLEYPRILAAARSADCLDFVARLCAVEELQSLEVLHASGVAVIRFSEDCEEATMLRRVASALRRLQPAPLDPNLAEVLALGGEREWTRIVRTEQGFAVWEVSAPGEPLETETRQQVAGFLDRLGAGRFGRGINLALAGASFGMAVVGVAVPGIPTVPFLLVTSFFLVRSSPQLNDRLHQSRLFGPMLRDWQKHRGMRWQTKALSLGFMATTVGITLLFFEAPPALLGLMFVMSAACAYWILNLPMVPMESIEGAENGGASDFVPMSFST